MRRSLAHRLQRHFVAASALAALAGAAPRSADAAIVYSGSVNINIPSTLAGIYLNVVTGVRDPVPGNVPGWDVDPWSAGGLNMFAPGVGVGPGGHVGGATTYYNLAPGTLIGPSSTFSGTGTATIDGSTPLNLNSSANLVGFRFQNENTGNTVNYGWMRISLSGTAAGQPRAIVEYAYEDTGAAIAAGDVGNATGACCKPDGTCGEGLTGAACNALGGQFVANTLCASANCPAAGACCKPDGTCVSNATFGCSALGGTFNGAGSTCAGTVCTGACCNSDGTCTAGSNPAACTSAGGTYLGNGFACSSGACLGACCNADGTCSRTTAAACTGASGTFRGVGIACNLLPCVGGACCLPDGTCSMVPNTGSCTALSGTYAGDGSWCAANTCPGNPALTGACCATDDTCSEQTRDACFAAGGYYRGNGVLCASTNCGGTGACCQLDGTCFATTLRGCRSAGGWYGGDGVACGAGVCPTVYTYGGNPVVILDSACTALNQYAEITVPDSVTINSADAAFMIPHTYQTDLRFILVHVDTGTSALLVNRQGGGSDNFGDPNSGTPIRFLDRGGYRYAGTPQGPLPAAGGPVSPTGDWMPGQALSVFNGENSVGKWRLYGQDCAGADTGTIMLFKLALKGTPAVTCYANCDASTQPPVLNIADFTCFLQKFAASAPSANCDNSTQPPVLNIADFTCFLQKFAAGCS